LLWRRDMRKHDKPPQVYVFFGLIASGKSTLAQAWAGRLHIPYYNSDIMRKELAEVENLRAGKQEYGRGIYSDELTRKTYQTLLSQAADAVANGWSVILDASYRCRADRDDVRGLKKKHGARVRFILCSCPEAEARTRMKKRELDPTAVSDGSLDIYLRQKEIFEPPAELQPDELIALSTMAPVDVLVDRLARALEKNSK
jgi:predicted kinase